MALVASQVRVAGTGELYVAETTATAPTDSETALGTPWKGLGYTQDDGATISRSLDREEVSAWQSVTPIRYIYNGATLTVAAAMLQSNDDIVKLWFGGGDFAETSVGSGEFKADMPTIPTGVERSVVLEWSDDDIKSRLYIPRAELSDTGDVQISRTAPAAFQMTWSALAPSSGTVLATWFTNDAAFNPTA